MNIHKNMHTEIHTYVHHAARLHAYSWEFVYVLALLTEFRPIVTAIGVYFSESLLLLSYKQSESNGSVRFAGLMSLIHLADTFHERRLMGMVRSVSNLLRGGLYQPGWWPAMQWGASSIYIQHGDLIHPWLFIKIKILSALVPLQLLLTYHLNQCCWCHRQGNVSGAGGKIRYCRLLSRKFFSFPSSGSL